MNKKFIQLLPTISYGDAVSNDALAMADALTELGYENEIYAVNIDPRIINKAIYMDKLRLNSTDIVIYHMAISSHLSKYVFNLKNRKVMVYHNITPASFFTKYSSVLYRLCLEGREQLKYLSNSFDLSLADSEYNKTELEELGYKNVYRLPIIIKFNDYKTEPDRKTIEKFSDGYDNILFVGRIAPNKKQEDVIKCFYLYKKYINPKSRLFLIGSHSGMEIYVQALNQLISNLNLQDVHILGHISFEEILAYYRVASVFLCMSEHEGFCVPLLESMYFNVPIIAYDAAAVPETLGNSGIVFTEKRYEVVAELIDLVVTNREIREKIIALQSERLKDFDEKKVKEQFKNYIKMMV